MVKSLPTAKLIRIIANSAQLIKDVVATTGNSMGEKDEFHRKIRLLRARNAELEEMLRKLVDRLAKKDGRPALGRKRRDNSSGRRRSARSPSITRPALGTSLGTRRGTKQTGYTNGRLHLSMR